ncbi:hypothetical protein BDA96_03G256300 [Sorghum bicolor]|uniref:Uncharacterized protein n=2 Tax=Sorghum bicolor TaxID=4558 RepID=A0A921RFJ7_SORBI|nr:hypothetical protein BDA96_03G256300 [Sorghum bicolor]OQU87229.1 hypothetical protein SORBI_3003G236501 [Sorghum bicolor]
MAGGAISSSSSPWTSRATSSSSPLWTVVRDLPWPAEQDPPAMLAESELPSAMLAGVELPSSWPGSSSPMAVISSSSSHGRWCDLFLLWPVARDPPWLAEQDFPAMLAGVQLPLSWPESSSPWPQSSSSVVDLWPIISIPCFFIQIENEFELLARFQKPIQ